MTPIFLRTLLVLISLQLISLNGFFISNAWSIEGLPSQKARFQGMGSTLKEQKKQTFFLLMNPRSILKSKYRKKSRERILNFIRLSLISEMSVIQVNYYF